RLSVRLRWISAFGTTCIRAGSALTAAPPRCSVSTVLRNGYLPINGNVIKRDLSFVEGYAKGTFTVNDQVAYTGSVFYSPSVLNEGAPGTYVTLGAKFTAPSSVMPEGW